MTADRKDEKTAEKANDGKYDGLAWNHCKKVNKESCKTEMVLQEVSYWLSQRNLYFP